MPDKHDDTYGLNFTPPRNMIVAHSLVQQWYVAESSGEPFAKDFFTWEHVMQFSTVAIKSALADSLIWLGIYVLAGAIIYFVQENYLMERFTQLLFWQVKGSPLFWFAKLSSFMGLIFHTAICVSMSRYYTGTVPRRAVNTIFATRAIFLACFSLVAFLLLGVVYRALGTPQVLAHIILTLTRFRADLGEKASYFIIYYFRRALFEAGIVSLVASLACVIIPFLSIGFFRFYKRRKEGLGVGAA